MFTVTVGEHKFTHHVIDNQVYFESPITGELILIKPPYFMQKYNVILQAHIDEVSKLVS